MARLDQSVLEVERGSQWQGDAILDTLERVWTGARVDLLCGLTEGVEHCGNMSSHQDKDGIDHDWGKMGID